MTLLLLESKDTKCYAMLTCIAYHAHVTSCIAGGFGSSDAGLQSCIVLWWLGIGAFTTDFRRTLRTAIRE